MWQPAAQRKLQQQSISRPPLQLELTAF